MNRIFWIYPMLGNMFPSYSCLNAEEAYEFAASLFDGVAVEVVS